jgi:hypothetical protein
VLNLSTAEAAKPQGPVQVTVTYHCDVELTGPPISTARLSDDGVCWLENGGFGAASPCTSFDINITHACACDGAKSVNLQRPSVLFFERRL